MYFRGCGVRRGPIASRGFLRKPITTCDFSWAWGREGSNCFSRGSVPLVLRKPIATCDFSWVWGPEGSIASRGGQYHYS